MAELSKDGMGRLLSLIVHDLRNPTATLSANLAYIRDVLECDSGGLSSDVLEALEDAGIALGDLMQGLDQFAWVSRWLSGDLAVHANDGDVVSEVRAAAHRHKQVNLNVDVDPADHHLQVRGGSLLAKLIDTLIANSVQHAGEGSRTLRAFRRDDRVILELCDRGKAIAPELRDQAFTLDGQWLLKGRSDGRYGRVVGLFAAATLAEAIGAKLEADGSDGHAILRLLLEAV